MSKDFIIWKDSNFNVLVEDKGLTYYPKVGSDLYDISRLIRWLTQKAYSLDELIEHYKTLK